MKNKVYFCRSYDWENLFRNLLIQLFINQKSVFMKQFLKRLLLVALLCVPWVTNAQSTLTVADGTETNDYVPIYGFYNDAFNRIQILYHADSITAMQGSSINSLTFYSANATGSWGSAVFTIKMATVTQNTLSDYLSDDLFTTCWEGSFEVVNGVAYVELDDPFMYTGDNLVIQIWNTTGSYSSSSFYGVTLNGASIQSYNYNGVPSSGATARNFLPKTTFEYGTITCPKPTGLTVVPDNDQAELNWTAGGQETSWIVYVGGEPITTVSTPSYTMTDLTSNTVYDVAVRAFCGVDDTSAFVSTTFRSQCFDYTPVPYSTGFEDDDDGELPSCWSAFATGTSGSGIFPSVYDYSTNARNGDIYFEFESNSGQTEIAVLPAMENINTLQLEFYASCMNNNFVFEVGVVDEDSVFVPVDTVNLITGNGNNWHYSYNPYTIYFDQYSGTGERMAIRVTSTSSYTIMVDDISVSEIPSCLPPSHVVVDSIGANWIGLSWTDSNATSWEIIFDTLPFDPATSELTPVALNDTYVVLEGLFGGMEYTAYLRGDCGGDNSPWVGPINFIPGTVNMSYSGTDTVRGCGLVVYDDGGAEGEYTVYANSKVVLYPSSEDSLIVFSGSTDIYSYYAKLRIYDGVGTNGTILWESSDYNETIPLTTSFSGPITIHFNAGSYNYGYTGFELHTSCIAAPQCASIQNLQVQGVTTTSAYVDWSVSGLNLGVPTGYEVNCYDSTGTLAFTETTTAPNVMITSLEPASPYTVLVRTLCDDDNYGSFDSVIFTTLSLACVEMNMSNSHFDTIGNGTSTSSYLPVYTCYNYSLTQQIYKASELNGAGSLSSISFMPSSIATPNGTSRNIELYVGHIADSSAANFVYPSDLSLVYSGSPTFVADQWCQIDFDQSFAYNGTDNLLVIFRDLTGAYSCSNSWYVHSAGSNASHYVYQDASPYSIGYTGGYSTSDRMNAVFGFVECTQLATCAAPLVVVDSVATDYIGISWAAGYQETSWAVEYRPDTTDTWISAGTSNTTSMSFSNLTTNLRYHFRVGAVCSDTVIYTYVSAMTKCGSEPLPFMNGFENFPSTGTPSCWYSASSYSYSSYPSVTTYTVHNGSQALYMYSSSSTYTYLVLPELDAPVDTLEMSFWMYASYSGYANELMVGVMSDAENFSTFQNVGVVSVSDVASWTPVKVRFNNYQGTGSRIAIVSPTSDYVDIYIDDIAVNIISPCTDVENISLDYATVDSAILVWDSFAVDGYEYVYGLSGFDIDTVASTFTSVNGAAIGNLSPNTQYDIYVRAICGGGDTSNWSNAFSFRTDCVKITSVPYDESFENNAPGWGSNYSQNFYPCWTRVSDPNDSYYYPYLSDYGAHTGSQSLYWNWDSYDNFNPWIALPAVDTNVINIADMMLSFWAYNGYSNNEPTIVVGTMTDPQSIATFQALDTVTFTNTSYAKYEIPLSNYSGNGEYIALVSAAPLNGSTYWYGYMDDITLDSIPSCMHVFDLAITGNTSSSVSIAWNELGSATTWDVAYDTDPNAIPVADTTVTGTSAATITGLVAGTPYYFWVRSVCSATDASAWEGPVMSIPGSWFMIPNQTDTLYMCGGVVTDDGGPAGAYSSNQDSYVIIRPETPGSLVAVDGTSYTEGTWDHLHIYDGEGTSGVELWNDYGVTSSQTFGPFISSTGAITLYFTSDGSVTYDGFVVNVSCYLDNCPVSDLMLDESVAASSNSLAITWTGSSTSYDVVYGPAGFDVETATDINNTTSNSYVVTGLDPITSYDVYVRGLCNAGDTGMWHKITLMTAMCDGVVTIYNYDTTQAETTSSSSPIGYSYYNYSYVQTIIPAARLAELAGDVTAMAFQPSTTTAGSYFTNMKVWMSNVSEDYFTDGFILEDSAHTFNMVIDGADFSYNSTEWQIHGLDTAFVWDGVSNILVSVSREHGAWTSGSSFNAHQDTVARTVYDYNDNYTYDPATASINYGDVSSTVGDIILFSCGAACPKPTLLPTTDITYEGATLNWGGNATDFEVAVKAATDATWPAEVAVSNATSYVVTDLMPETMYQFRVRAICDAAEGLISDWVEGTFTTAELPCFTYTVTGLAANTSYYAAVKALCGNGIVESGYSDTVQFTTNACGRVTGVTTSGVTAHSVVVSWNDSGVSKYKLEYGDRNFSEGNGTTIIVDNATSYTITNLDEDHNYSVFVKAICEEGVEGDWSEQADFTTPEQGEGINEVSAANQLSIYPNPANDVTTIAVSGVNGEVSITIVDMNGRVVASDSMSCEGDCTKSVEVSGLAQGAYFVRVNGENLSIVRKLIVK